MAWRISGTYWAPCSCNVGCPCLLGEMKADQGWCSAALVFDIRTGQVNNVDVSGAKVALAADWPGGFLEGNGQGRIYFDRSLSQQQRDALEPIVKGQAGGALAGIGMLTSTFLSNKDASIDIQRNGDETRIEVGEVGRLVSVPLRGANGHVTRLLHGAASFRDDVVLARGTGTMWQDPELRQWESGGHSEQADFDWTG